MCNIMNPWVHESISFDCLHSGFHIKEQSFYLGLLLGTGQKMDHGQVLEQKWAEQIYMQLLFEDHIDLDFLQICSSN